MRPRVILFDADGMTLIPQRFSDQIQVDYGISWEKMKPFFSGAFQDCKRGKADLKEELAKAIPVWGWTKSIDELISYWFSIGSNVQPEIPLLIKTLQDKGIACYLATNQEKYRLAYLKEIVGLNRLFNGFFASTELGSFKNESVFFEQSYEILRKGIPDLKKTEILFIDHEEQNLEVARAFGYTIYQYVNIELFSQEIVSRV